jgi:hypothetical protein
MEGSSASVMGLRRNDENDPVFLSFFLGRIRKMSQKSIILIFNPFSSTTGSIVLDIEERYQWSAATTCLAPLRMCLERKMSMAAKNVAGQRWDY